MTSPPRPAGAKRGHPAADDLAARMGALPQTQPAAAARRPAAARKPPAAPQDAGKGRRPAKRPAAPAAPAEQAKPDPFYSERLSITTTIGQLSALRVARAADGIQATARLRAMIALWQDDPKVRARVDRAAKDWAGPV